MEDEALFHQAMLDIYETARRLEPPYVATRFLEWLMNVGAKPSRTIYWQPIVHQKALRSYFFEVARI